MQQRKDYFSDLNALLEKEKQAEREQFENLLKKQSIDFRIQQGFTWFPLKIHEDGYGLGSYPFLEVERTRKLEFPHQFGAGKAVELFTLQDPEEPAIRGNIHYVDGNRMKIIFFRDELPDWIDDGKIGVNLVFDDQQYREMEKALETCSSARNTRLADLVDVLLGNLSPSGEPVILDPDVSLNPSQQEAVACILAANDIAFIHGPPGTGKTTTLVAAIEKMVAEKQKILVCCPSNAATDHITLKLAESGLHTVRVGNISRIDEKIISHTMEHLVEVHPQASEWKNYRKRANEFRRMAGKYKRVFGKEEKIQRDLLYKEARDLSREANNLEEYMVIQILNSAQVVTSTLVGAEHRLLKERSFDVVIIDEAAQALEPATWIPIAKAKKVVLAGDPFQLPPTVKGEKTPGIGLSITLLEKCISIHPEWVRLLEEQYRMHEDIMAYPNVYFYANKLKAAPKVAHHRVNNDPFFADPIHFIDTAGCGFEEIQDPESKSYHNPKEVELILHLLSAFRESLETSGNTWAVISPYREQVLMLKAALKNRAEADTIDSFQGQERDCIFISLVRSNLKSEIGFLADYRRMNVAITRARKKLVVIGDSATIGNDRFYEGFFRMCEEKGFYHSAWEWIGEM